MLPETLSFSELSVGGTINSLLAFALPLVSVAALLFFIIAGAIVNYHFRRYAPQGLRFAKIRVAYMAAGLALLTTIAIGNIIYFS